MPLALSYKMGKSETLQFITLSSQIFSHQYFWRCGMLYFQIYSARSLLVIYPLGYYPFQVNIPTVTSDIPSLPWFIHVHVYAYNYIL